MPTVRERNLGIYGKYEIRRVEGNDGPNGKHGACDLFVLDITHDPFARAAALAYAGACMLAFPKLASDLRDKVKAAIDEEILGIVRMSGEARCEVCDEEYWRHPDSHEHLDWEGHPYLTRLCDGRLVKL